MRRSPRNVAGPRNVVEPKNVAESRDAQYGIGDPAFAEYLGLGMSSDAGISVSPLSSMALSSVWRCLHLIAGTIASLPLKSYRRAGDKKERINTFLDQPHPDMTQYEWVETVMSQLLLWGNAYLLHFYGGAGQIAGLTPINPELVGHIKVDENLGKVFSVRWTGGMQREFTALDLTHVPSLNYDGIVGISPITVARQSLGTALASDRVAARVLKNGMLLGGVMSLRENATKTQVIKILDGLKRKSGVDSAGDVAFIPAAVNFQPWTMNCEDAQFLESRHFSVEEVARWYGVPRELLSQSGASSWGTGIQELVRAFARFTLSGWTKRVEQRLTLLLPKDQFCEFDYSEFLQSSPAEEIQLLISQVQGGLLTVDEARAIRNLPPLPKSESPEMTPEVTV